MLKRLVAQALTWEDSFVCPLGASERRSHGASSAWALYPLDAIFMPAGPAAAEIADLTHCGNILTRCAVTNARCAAGCTSRDPGSVG